MALSLVVSVGRNSRKAWPGGASQEVTGPGAGQYLYLMLPQGPSICSFHKVKFRLTHSMDLTHWSDRWRGSQRLRETSRWKLYLFLCPNLGSHRASLHPTLPGTRIAKGHAIPKAEGPDPVLRKEYQSATIFEKCYPPPYKLIPLILLLVATRIFFLQTHYILFNQSPLVHQPFRIIFHDCLKLPSDAPALWFTYTKGLGIGHKTV